MFDKHRCSNKKYCTFKILVFTVHKCCFKLNLSFYYQMTSENDNLYCPLKGFLFTYTVTPLILKCHHLTNK